MDRAEAEALYDAGRDACVAFLLELAAGYERQIAALEERLDRLEAQARQDSRTSSKPPSSDPPKSRAQRRAEARAKAKKLMRREGAESGRAGGQEGHQGAGRGLRPGDQIDEIVDHYPDACGSCGHEFAAEQHRPGGRFGRHQVVELPPISAVWSEHRTHQLRCRRCRARTTATLPAVIAGSVFGSRLQAAIVTLTAAYRIFRRGIAELAVICSVSRSRLVRSTRSANAPQTRWLARTASCRTGCSTRARCTSMRPAGGPAATGARCGPRPPPRRCSCRSLSTATASNSTR